MGGEKGKEGRHAGCHGFFIVSGHLCSFHCYLKIALVLAHGFRGFRLEALALLLHSLWDRTPRGACSQSAEARGASQQTESKRLEEASNEAPPSLLSYIQRVHVHVCVCTCACVQVWKLETCQEPILSFYPADSRNQIQDVKLQGKRLSSGSLFTCLQSGPLPCFHSLGTASTKMNYKWVNPVMKSELS